MAKSARQTTTTSQKSAAGHMSAATTLPRPPGYVDSEMELIEASADRVQGNVKVNDKPPTLSISNYELGIVFPLRESRGS